MMVKKGSQKGGRKAIGIPIQWKCSNNDCKEGSQTAKVNDTTGFVEVLQGISESDDLLLTLLPSEGKYGWESGRQDLFAVTLSTGRGYHACLWIPVSKPVVQ